MARIKNNNFVQLKRFFRDNNIKYIINAPFLIVNEPGNDFPATLFKFDDENDYIEVNRIPLEGISHSFQASGLYDIIIQMLRFNLLEKHRVKRLKIRDINFIPGQLKVSKSKMKAIA